MLERQMLVARRFGAFVQPERRPVLRAASIAIHARKFNTVRCICEENKDPRQPPKGGPETGKKGTQPWLEPTWNSIKEKFDDSLRVVNKYATGTLYHFGKAREAIREANKKIAEQERDRSDQRLNYNKDIENDGRIHGLPSEREMHRRKWSRKLEFYLDSLQETIFTATRALNDVTGYSSIQKLRKSIELMERTLEKTRGSLKAVKADYASAIEERTESQRELNELLQRKNTWSPEELDRFTQLYRNDAMNLRKEQDLKDKVNDMEAKQEELSDDLYRAILTRYHEEQIWSDKIRRTSTWGTLVLMIVNIVLFLVFQLLLEPWKRRRLTSSFEDKVKAALDEYAGEQNTALKEMSATMSRESTSKGEQQAAVVPPLQDDEPISTEPCDGRIDIESGAPSAEQRSERAWYFFSTIRHKAINLWHWIEGFTSKFDVATALHLHAEKTFTNLELYAYSLFLLMCGTGISHII